MSTTFRTASFLVAASLLAACGRDAVEHKLVGSWETAVASPTGAYELRFTTQSNGLYRTDVVGAAAVAPEIGLLKATSGHWRLERSAGGADEGTYEFESDDSVLFKSKTGVVLWTRVRNGVAATQGSPSQPASPATSSAGPGETSGAFASGRAAPDAAVLETGPFGAAIEGSAEALPGSAGLASGAQNAAGFTAPVPSPRNLPQATTPSANQPGATAQPLPTMTTKQAVAHTKATVQQTASQTVATARAGAQQITSQAATSATDAVDSAAAETNKKVGQKIGTFAGNVGSKIKNFFTGANRHAADAGSADGSAKQAGN